MKLAEVNQTDLPPELQKLDSAALKAEIDKKQKERSELQTRIQKLSEERAAYLEAERKRQHGKMDSFDEKVAASIREQAAKKGIVYGK